MNKIIIDQAVIERALSVLQSAGEVAIGANQSASELQEALSESDRVGQKLRPAARKLAALPTTPRAALSLRG